jgi:hypothetical protein
MSWVGADPVNKAERVIGLICEKFLTASEFQTADRTCPDSAAEARTNASTMGLSVSNARMTFGARFASASHRRSDTDV